MPSINAKNAPYVLRSCLGKEPADTVKSVDDDITPMWKRLEEKYGDPAKVPDVVRCAIQNIKPIREGENKKYVELIYQRHRRRLPRLEKIRFRERNNYSQFGEHNRKKTDQRQSNQKI